MFYTHFHVFEPCSNSLLCSGVLFEHFEQCSNIMHYFACCPNTVWTCSTLTSMHLNHVQTSCAALHAVQTLSEQCLDMLYIHFHVFEHHTLLRMLSEHCSDSVWTCYTFVSMCLNSVRTVWSCLAKFEHFEQCSNCVLMPTTCSKSIPCLFSFPFSCLFVYSHPHPPTSTRTPICNTSTRPDQ